jgi:hypothetical protein
VIRQRENQNRAETSKSAQRCRAHEWAFTRQSAHPKGSAFGVQSFYQCKTCRAKGRSLNSGLTVRRV